MLPAAVRKWLHRPKRSDPRLLAQFFYADERLSQVVMEINGLDMETDPEQYLVLLSQLHLSQAHLLAVLEQIMDECIAQERPSRDYQAKFPEELMVDNLRNHMLFAAECLLAGTSLELEEADGVQLRPLAKSLLRSLQVVRKVLREQSLSQPRPCPEPVRQALIRFDTQFTDFELCYVSLLVSVKSPEEVYKQQEIVVLFCETVQRALELGYLTQEMIDRYEPLLMFTIPRLAILSGLLIYPEGPLSPDRKPEEMSRVFSPFHSVLKKIQALLHVLSEEELAQLEKSLCMAESESPRSTAAPEPRTETVHLHAPHACSPHPLPAEVPYCTLTCRGRMPAAAAAAAAHGAARGGTQGELATPSSERVPERLLPGRTRDLDAACAGSAWLGPRAPAKAAAQVVLGPACSTTRDTWLRICSAALEGAEHSVSLGPSLDRLWQCHACSANHGQLALMASGSEELSLPAGGVGACAHVQNGLARPGQAWACPPRLPIPSIGDSSRPLGQQLNSAQGRGVPAARLSVRQAELRSRYSSPAEMIHTLFVCISGVADQLQTNFASDLRSILKTVFRVVTSQPEALVMTDPDQEDDTGDVPPLAECALCSSQGQGSGSRRGNGIAQLPEWVLDSTCSECTACHAPFTVLRRRHHCRNCGQIFCSRCSQHTAPLPHYGQPKPVRVCAHCYTTHLPTSPRMPSCP